MRSGPRLPINNRMLLIVLGTMMLLGISPYAYKLTPTVRGVATIARGVHLPGLPLGGMSRQEAYRAVQDWEKKRSARMLIVRLGTDTWKIMPRKMGWRVDVDQVVGKALAVGRHGSWPNRWWERWQAMWNGMTIYPETPSATDAIRTWLSDLEAGVYRQPRNAYRDLRTDVVVKEKPGRRLDQERSLAAIQKALNTMADEAELVIATLQPHTTYEDVVKVQAHVELARYSTKFNSAMKNRVTNIRLAASMIDGMMVQPGEVFSFNETVGPRQANTGYREAPELLKGDTIIGIGGGVCQVSSTLYNTVLLTNMTVVERYKHSAVLGYVPAGRDATVSYGKLDFRFRNSLEHPIIIRVDVAHDYVSVSIWGSKPLPYRVKLWSEARPIPIPTIERYDASWASGRRVVMDEGKPGQLVIIHKQVTDSTSDQVQKAVVSRNLYPAKPRIVKVGSFKPNTPPPVDTSATSKVVDSPSSAWVGVEPPAGALDASSTSGTDETSSSRDESTMAEGD